MPVYWCVPGTGFRRCIGSLPGLKPRLRAGFWRQFSISGVFWGRAGQECPGYVFGRGVGGDAGLLVCPRREFSGL